MTIAAGLASTALAQQGTFFNKGTYEIPPQPLVDATNFVNANGGTFIATNGINELSLLAQPFTTSDTLNYTNQGTMVGSPGFDFEYFPSVPPPPQPGVPFNNMAANFVNQASGLNGGIIDCTAFNSVNISGLEETVFVNPKLVVGATNVIDSGQISMDSSGLIDFRGQDLDLRRGTLTMASLLSGTAYEDIEWGSGSFGTNSFGWAPGLQLTPTTASSPQFVANAANFPLGLFIEQMALTNSTPYFESFTGVASGNTIVWRVIFLQDSSPSNVAHNVYFSSLANGVIGNGEFHIEWAGRVQDPVTGAFSTNYLYLSDVPENRRSTNFSFAVPPDTQNQVFGDFTLASSPVKQFLGFPTTAGWFPAPLTNNGSPFPANLVVSNDFSYINAWLTPSAVTNGVLFSVTNVLGRVQLSASQSLNLANTRISGANYVRLSAPVDFRGNSNSFIAAPFADLNLGVTNSLFTVSNLLSPTIPSGWVGITNGPNAVVGSPEFMGGIQAFSGSYTFATNIITSITTDTNGVSTTNTMAITNDVRVLMVNSAVQPNGPALQQDVNLHTGSDLVISDQLNIYRSFSSDAQVLTITTNGPGAFSPSGVLNLLSSDIFWSGSLPNLQYLTNFGEIDSQNQVYFAGNMAGPYSDPNAATPYQAFINHGVITNQGTFIRTGVFENSGVIEDGFGSIDIAASSGALATNGEFIAPAGYVSIAADSLIASNGVIEAGGGPLTLNLNCFLSDGYLFGNQFAHFTNAFYPHVVTNGNAWTASGGIDIPNMPVSHTADLLGTTITNIALNNFVSPNVWPATDEGPNPDGFGDNLAVGRMILNADSTSQFNFIAANGSNAIYIDSIELQGNTTNTDVNGNPLSIAIEPGMNIYYAQAVENGISIAEKLNGKFGAGNTNGGQFFWVSTYAGVYSSTNITYPDNNTYIFNEALAISPDINSGGPDGSEVTNAFLVNLHNPYPIPTNVFYPPTVVSGPLACGNDTSASGGNSTNSTGSPRKILAQLIAPVETSGPVGSSNTPVVFSVAAGSYNGLFYDTNAVKPSSSGYISATVTSKGGFSAKLQFGSHTYSYSGSFDASGAAVFNATGKGLPALSVNLQLVNNDQIVGSVGGGNWLAELQADRAAFTSKNPTPSTGKDTLLLAADGEISTTGTGEGFGTATISKSGSVQFGATLPDGVKITQKSALSKAGVWPVYASLYGGNGVFIGWMQCTNQSDVEGSAVWEMPGGAGGLYSNGLTNQLNAAGSRIQGSIPASGHYALILSGAGLGTSSTNTFGVFGKKVQSSNSGLKLSVNPQTGLFSGSLIVPSSNQKLSFQGALLEKSAIGGGFFLNADQSGQVYFGPAN